MINDRFESCQMIEVRILNCLKNKIPNENNDDFVVVEAPTKAKSNAGKPKNIK